MMRLLYTLVFYLALPLIMLRLWRRGQLAPAYRERWGERFALGDKPDKQQAHLWIHTVSVGEFIAASPLIDSLLQTCPDLPLLVTTTTPTGSERVQQRFGDRVDHVYMPYDLPFLIQAFIKRWQPRALVIFETELWPNTIHCLYQAGIPSLLLNARLSEKSARGYTRFRAITSPMLQQLHTVAAQADADAKRFRELGMPSHKLHVTGSIKFDLNIAEDVHAQAEQLRQQWGDDRCILIAASTHEGEEALILEAFSEIKNREPRALLVIVPRHPERFDQVFEMSRARFTVVRRSEKTVVTAAVDVVVCDTMGELLMVFGTGDVAFIGGSLVPTGGHNMLEALAMGVPPVTGPIVFNFQTISDMLIEAGALSMVQDHHALVDEVLFLFGNKEECRQRVARGARILYENRGAKQRFIELIDAALQSGGRV